MAMTLEIIIHDYFYNCKSFNEFAIDKLAQEEITNVGSANLHGAKPRIDECFKNMLLTFYNSCQRRYLPTYAT